MHTPSGLFFKDCNHLHKVTQAASAGGHEWVHRGRKSSETAGALSREQRRAARGRIRPRLVRGTGMRRLRSRGAREGAGRGLGGDTWKAKLPQGNSGAGQRTGNGRCVGVASRSAAYISCSRAVQGELGREAEWVSRFVGCRSAGWRRLASQRAGSRALSEAAREVMLGAVGWAGYLVSGGGGLRCLRLF